MFGSIKKLFFKDTGEDLATSIPEVAAIAPDAEWSTISSKPALTTSTSQNPQPTVFAANAAASVEFVALPLASIFARLPNSLSSVVQSQGNGFVSLPSKRILGELPKGSVKITFGELRQAAPPGTFSDNVRHDQVLIELPLNEILMRLHPSLLSRRSDQKQIQISPEITNVFGSRGEGISISAPPVGTPKPIMAPPLKHVASGDTSISMRNITKPTSAPTPAPSIPAKPTVVAAPTLHIVEHQPETIQSPGPVIVSLALLCEGWPEMIRAEIGELNLLNARIALPLDKLEEALKAGKIVFTWKQICEWMQPPVNSPSGAQDIPVELPLKLIAPLFMAKHHPKIQKRISVLQIPDLFSGKAPETPETQAIETASQPAPIAFTAPIISVAPAPVAPTPPISLKPAVPPVELKMGITPEVKPVQPVTPSIEIKLAVAPEIKPSVLGEIFGQPAKHDWKPNEIVKSLSALPGIAGAFVAMQDGLLVAAELPSHLTADTVAAFLPQIFGRMNQYTKELKLGGLTSLTFVVENISWQIIKSGTVYLVALGKSGESLPGQKLNTIAAELGKQIQ